MKNQFLTLFYFLLSTPFLLAQVQLDPTFGTEGKVITNMYGNQTASEFLVQLDGKIVVVGTNNLIGSGLPHFMMLRYSANGTIDSTFGANGFVYTDFDDSFSSYATSLEIQSDGKLVAAGFVYNVNSGDDDFALVRYNANGILDSAFGINGKVTTNINNEGNHAYDVAIQKDGKILLTGSSYFSTALVRYNSNGTLDNNFGVNGIVYTTLSNIFWSSLDYLAIQLDGKIIAGGYYSVNIQTADFALVRFNVDGTIDTTFGNQGKVITPIGDYLDYISAIKIQTDGKILAIGRSTNIQNYTDFSLARYNIDGTLDSTFGLNGKVITEITSLDDDAKSVVIQSNGNIIVAETANIGNEDSANFSMISYLPNGLVNTDFGKNGIVATRFSGQYDWAQSIALQSDDKIILGGNSGENPDFALCRYNTITSNVFSNIVKDFNVDVFPNPTNNNLNIQLTENNHTIIQIEIRNFLGQIMYQTNTIQNNKAEINFSKYNKGLYFAVIILDNNQQLIQKIVVQ